MQVGKRVSERSQGNWRHLTSECLKTSRANKPIQQKEIFSSIELARISSETTHLTAELRLQWNCSFLKNINDKYANTEKHGAVDQRSAGSLALTLTVKTRLWGINETCLQGLNLSCYKVSELSIVSAMIWRCCSMSWMLWGSASHREKHKHSK